MACYVRGHGWRWAGCRWGERKKKGRKGIKKKENTDWCVVWEVMVCDWEAVDGHKERTKESKQARKKILIGVFCERS